MTRSFSTRALVRRPEPPLARSGAALFLDLDGTLAPIASRPEAVGPDPRRTEVLRRAQAALEGRLAVVSGRTLDVVDRILDGAVTCAAGVHGLERRAADGSVARPRPHPQLAAVRQALSAFAAAWPGVLVEDKGLSVALHYRLAPAAEAAVREEAERLGGAAGLAIQHGRKVIELRTPGADKGAAVAAFMAEPPFAGAAPIFVGDDLTDEHGFEAAERLGGFGVLVGPPRRTTARYGLADVDAVLDWLSASAAPPPRRG